MTQQTTQHWNTPKDDATDRLTDASDYVLIGRNPDGQSFVMSNGDKSLAGDLFKNANIGESSGARVG